MKIDPEDQRASVRRRWGLPLSVAAGVAAVSVTAVVLFGGEGAAGHVAAVTPLGTGSPVSATASPGPSVSPGHASASPAGSGTGSSATRGSSAPGAFTITSETTTPIDAGTVTKILASCLGSAAADYHAVIAVRTPVASQDWDGAVIAVNSADQYVQCETKGDQGTSQDSPATFINNRLWGAGHTIEYFDSVSGPAGQGQYLMLGAGHYTSDVARITISYGDDPTQYPAVMAGGAFFYTAAASTGTTGPSAPVMSPSPYVHAYDASGKEIYNQQQDS
ncbi:hypothetical protein GXW83_17410 [Streptacidiphilus sp. PB12-B1b]|uniref:hypothetical protein n=1 Tax=Streptacidiphilus sp. PB12-B1b TaxID=2705012 RepID=UPI0015FA1BFB|nr:hypothetical protein [Streptacidiphilus sp. PB12-B1b]QMU77218.1 hypothetical protein GXW83_17410 [Streptacidiphilus sp. PB12-B1b]